MPTAERVIDDHDELINSGGNAHIDWTAASNNLLTTGTLQGQSLRVDGGAAPTWIANGLAIIEAGVKIEADEAGWVYATWNRVEVNYAAGANKVFVGNTGSVKVIGSGSIHATDGAIYGQYSGAYNSSSGIVSNAVAVIGAISNSGAGSITSGYAFKSAIAESAGTITDAYHYYITDSTGTPTTQYGVYLEDLDAAGTNYGIYFAGTSGLARQGLNWNGDTNLYRSAANMLKTDDGLTCDELTTTQVNTTGIAGKNIQLDFNAAQFRFNVSSDYPTLALDTGGSSVSFLQWTGTELRWTNGGAVATSFYTTVAVAGRVPGLKIYGYPTGGSKKYIDMNVERISSVDCGCISTDGTAINIKPANTQRLRIDASGITVSGGVDREGLYLGKATAVQAYDGQSEISIEFDSDTKIDSDYYGHSVDVSPEQITIAKAGWYRINYTINVDSDEADRVTWKGFVYNSTQASTIDSLTSYEYTRKETYAREGSLIGNDVVELAANDVIILKLTARHSINAWGGTNIEGDTIVNETHITIERVAA